MTNQEAKALAARLTRIWSPVETITIRSRDEGDVWTGWGCSVTVRSGAIQTTNLCVVHAEFDVPVYFLNHEDGFIQYYDQQGGIKVIPFQAQDQAPSRFETFSLFVAHWMPSFLRNCWLSGCPIEATAHEKMEWIQGFTREEIRSWNLKF